MINLASGMSDGMSPYTRKVIQDCLDASGNPSCLVTCMGRTPREQAVVMRANILRTGVPAQMEIYDPPGQAVIQVFVKSWKLLPEPTIDAMVAEIVRQGPAQVSHHCCDPAKIGVQDIEDSSLKDPKAFFIACKADARVSKALWENGCCHLEIPTQ